MFSKFADCKNLKSQKIFLLKQICSKLQNFNNFLQDFVVFLTKFQETKKQFVFKISKVQKFQKQIF